MSRFESLPGEDRRHRLVDQGEAGGEVALADADQPQLGEGAELQIDVARVASELDGLAGQRFGAIEVGHPVGASDVDPAVQGTGWTGSSSRSARPIQPLAAAKLAKFAL